MTWFRYIQRNTYKFELLLCCCFSMDDCCFNLTVERRYYIYLGGSVIELMCIDVTFI